VARVALGEAEAVIKRYNLKSVGHALSRLWRPSRAWHSWREAHRLQLFGIATPLPLALIEERLGPLRRRAWLVTDHCPGESLDKHLSAEREPPAAEAAAIVSLFATLHRLRISHGDLKATNLLWHAGEIWLIDLDACTQHRSETAYRQAWGRDRARLLRNWPEASVLGRWLPANLPPA
jgi:tRNA A-37 threonylcarbamoyl transferase component Bud32